MRYNIKKGGKIILRIPTELKDKLRRLAHRRGVSMSEVIRAAIEERLAEREKERA